MNRVAPSLDQAKKVAACSELRQLRLIESNSRVAVNLNFDSNTTLIYSHDEQVTVTERSSLAFGVVIKFHLNITHSHPVDTSGHADGEPLAELGVTYLLEYDGDSAACTESDMDAFAKTNALFHAWPYWREAVQSGTARMGLFPLILPVLKFQRQD